MTMQLDPINLSSKAPGMKLLKLKYDNPASKFAFKFNLRRYTKGAQIMQLTTLTGHSALPSHRT